MDVGDSGRRGSQRAILALALLAFGLVAAACASHRPQGAGGAAKATVNKAFRAYNANGDLAVTVADVAPGSCWTTSIAAAVPGAYRCLSGNQILDPCFAAPAKPGPVEVACLETPWSQATVLHLTGALPKPDPADDGDSSARPWAFELDNGVRCVASTGTVPAVQGVSLGYHCLDGRAAALLDPSATPMTADYGDPRTQSLQPVTVTTIWRG